MHTTTNFDLRLYETGDLFNPLTSNNSNFEDIDTNMKAILDRAIGRATELVSQGVHAITVLDTDCKTIKWVATANFTAGETFTINGIQCNAYLPSGEALGTNAYVSGAQVIGSLNDDNSAITIYVPQGTVAVASDSERLGGQLPSYYATKEYADGIKSTADSASDLIGKKALVNTYYDSSTDKLYQVNADGTQGNEIDISKPYIQLCDTESTSSGSQTINDISAFKEIIILAYASANGGVRGSTTIPVSAIAINVANELRVDAGLISYRFETSTKFVYTSPSTFIGIKVLAR